MRLTKKNQIYLIRVKWIASYDSYLRVPQNKRTSFRVFLYLKQIGSSWNLLKPERNIHSAYVRFFFFFLQSSISSIAKRWNYILQNFLESFLPTNCFGIFMLITFAKGPVRPLASSTGLSILHPSTPAAGAARCTLYFALVHPILEYASTNWHPLNIKLTNWACLPYHFAAMEVISW